MQEGLMVTNGKRGAVLLPGEAKTSTWAIAECCRKAGIRPQGEMLYRFRTTVFGPEED
jgi:AMMECR1 domain-containing protein